MQPASIFEMKQLLLRTAKAMGYAIVHEPVFLQLQERARRAEERLEALSKPAMAAAPTPEALQQEMERERQEYTGTNLSITDRQYKALLPLLAERRDELFKIPFVRDYLATQRHKHLTRDRAVDYAPFDDSDVLGNTVKYNQGALDHYLSLDRIRITLNVVNSISTLGRNPHERKILLIGPRSETELYSALAAGFAPSNISALDLFSYSPLVTPGDMHAIPFADDHFDIVFITCVLSYSKNVGKVASEVTRVLKDGGYVAFVEPMHYDFLPAEHKPDVPKPYDKADDLEPAPAFYGKVDDVLNLFGDRVAEVNFRSDPSPPYDGWGLMLSTIFKIRK